MTLKITEVLQRTSFLYPRYPVVLELNTVIAYFKKKFGHILHKDFQGCVFAFLLTGCFVLFFRGMGCF